MLKKTGLLVCVDFPYPTKSNISKKENWKSHQLLEENLPALPVQKPHPLIGVVAVLPAVAASNFAFNK